MKPFVLHCFLFLFFGTFALAQAQTNEIPLATGEWEPYTGEKLPNFGFIPELVSAVYKEMGITPKYEFVPWKRAEDMIRKGEVFASFPYIKTDERSKEFDFSDEVAVSTFVLFYHKDFLKEKVVWEKFEDLAKYSIGGTLGYWYADPFKQANLNVELVPKEDQNFQKMMKGKIQLIASEELVGLGYIKTLFPNDTAKFDIVSKPLKQDSLRLMVSRKYANAPDLLAKFNTSLKSIKDKGIYKKILEKFGVKDTK